METILTAQEAEHIFEKLTEKAKAQIKNDIIRFGEYFIGRKDDSYFRINPINVVISDGKPKVVTPDSITEI
ncbi:hypothetical protein [Pedobacter sp. SYSU D00535]|uniref:hypothetical protein n=1 Tax=Pedobacter sp. SYSU D00535 TaxID=2810308 RepID=UPI001A95FA32|nr:hypothetical protein [Pedobacter sp. SYSU D00535]